MKKSPAKLLSTLAAIGVPIALIGIGTYTVYTHQAKSSSKQTTAVSNTIGPAHTSGDESIGSSPTESNGTTTDSQGTTNSTQPNQPPATQNQPANAADPSNVETTTDNSGQHNVSGGGATETQPSIPANAATRSDVVAALTQVMGNNSMETYLKSDERFVTVSQLDKAYWDYIGIPSDHAAYQPGRGDVHAWGDIVGINDGLPDSMVTKRDLTQLQHNLQVIQQGYEVLGAGSYRLTRQVMDSLKYIAGSNVSPQIMSQAMTEAYRFTNAITVHVVGGKVTLDVPGHSMKSPYQVVVHTMGTGSDYESPVTNYEVSTDDGATWKAAVMYNSAVENINGNYTGGMVNPPAFVQVQPVNRKVEMEIMLWGPTGPKSNPLQPVSIGIQFGAKSMSIGSLSVPLGK